MLGAAFGRFGRNIVLQADRRRPLLRQTGRVAGLLARYTTHSHLEAGGSSLSSNHDYASAMSDICEPQHLREVYENTVRGYADARKMISPHQGRFLAWMVGSRRCRRVLELGCFTGYSALWMAEGLASLPPNVGAERPHIWTCEIDPEVARAAAENVARSNKSDLVTVIPKPAEQV
ncbi:hypothetical protein EV182_002903, partial [Spiromyces aspiralis]